METSAGRRGSEGRGWVAFAGVMFLIAATFNAVYGISALVNDDYFRADELLFGDMSFWGVVYLIIAATQFVTALLVFSRSAAGVVVGIALAMLNATLTLLSIGAYPVWSIIVLVVDGLIIYGLTVHGTAEDY
jgi:hypothetical protein